MLLVGLVVGLAAGAGAVALAGGNGDPSPEVAPADAAEPVRALTEFLRAEQQGDYEASFALLSDAERAELGSPLVWENLHGELPTIVDAETGAVAVDGDEAEIVSEVRFEPVLDVFSGLVPGEAVVTWRLERSDEGWLVVYQDAQAVPVYPGDDAAVPAVEAWLTARAACEPVDVDVALLGSPSLAEGLCDASTVPGVRSVGDLDDPAIEAVLVDAFGEDARNWARQVELGDGADFGVVVGPLGDEWVVTGVFPAPAGPG